MRIRRFFVSVSSLLAAVALVFAGTTAANAAVDGYDGTYYNGYIYRGYNPGTTYVGDAVNDRISSFRADGTNGYCEDADYKGRRLEWWDDARDLSTFQNDLWWWENWNNRISSWFHISDYKVR